MSAGTLRRKENAAVSSLLNGAYGLNRVLITGANGFVGHALCSDLAERGNRVVAAVRRPSGLTGERVIGDIGPDADWQSVLSGCDAVVHLAARVHVMRDTAVDPLAEFRRVNTDGTLNLARQAVAAGIRRLVYVSTIKVNGEGRDAPYSELDAPDARDAYARSKWEAEQGLSELAARTGLEVVILRHP
jgi:nucleoside-diphosphate-sugar epimerase